MTRSQISTFAFGFGVERVEREAGRAQSLVMTGNAVLIEDSLRAGRRRRCRLLGLSRPDLDARDGSTYPAADEERKDRGESAHPVLRTPF